MLEPPGVPDAAGRAGVKEEEGVLREPRLAACGSRGVTRVGEHPQITSIRRCHPHFDQTARADVVFVAVGRWKHLLTPSDTPPAA